MTRALRAFAPLLLTATLGGPLGAQARDARVLIDRAANAIGGVAALDSLRTKTMEFSTVAFGLGQEETPGSPPRATFFFGRTITDFARTRQWTTQEVRLGTGLINRQRRVTLPTMSLLETNGVAQMEPAAVAAGLERGQSLSIEKIMTAAAHHPSAASWLPPRIVRGVEADGIRMLLGPDTVSVWFDRVSGLPVASEQQRDDDILGDRRTLTLYTRWAPSGAVLLPRQIDVEVNGRMQAQTILTQLAVNAPLDESQFVIPDSMAQRAPAPLGAARETVALERLGTGVWRAAGGNYHSLIVEQREGLVVVEAPQSTARTAALLDTLASRFPGRPIVGIVMTHHHWDHSGGVRVALARGHRLIAHERNVPFVRSVGTARKTLAPDRLSRGLAMRPVMAVRDSLVLGSGDEQVVLLTVPSVHGEGILAAWVPSAGVLFTSDVLSGAGTQPPPRVGSLEMAAFARARGLRPTRFVGGHGTIVDWSAVEAVR